MSTTAYHGTSEPHQIRPAKIHTASRTDRISFSSSNMWGFDL